MPSKKKKYNARFPPARIKKIMQSDEDVGKVAQAVPVIISRALELFVESLLKKAEVVTQARNAKTLTPSHLKQCIMSEQRFDFLRDLVSSVSDVQGDEDLDVTTPRPGGSSGDHAFSFQSQNQGPSTSAASSSGAAAAPSASNTQDQPQIHQQHHHSQSPEYNMMSLQNPLQQHYIKKEDNVVTTGTKSEQNYAPMSSSAAAASSGGATAMTRSQPQYASVISHHQHLQQPPGMVSNNSPYIPNPAAAIHLQQPPQQQAQHPHFYYGPSPYDNSNGNVKPQGVVVQATDMNRHYNAGSDHGQHSGYDYAVEPPRHHY